MFAVKRSIDTPQKLRILSRDSRYDLACACATGAGEHRRRSPEGKWIYPVLFPGGRKTFLFKTLLSNRCVNNCRYCPLRAGSDSAGRVSLTPEELSGSFFSYLRSGKVSGLFLSSGVAKNADDTMEKINRTALILRRRRFRGYIHLKIIPGASDAAIRQSVALANAVSLNIETPGDDNFRKLSTTKNYSRDIIAKIELISRLTKDTYRLRAVKHTTQFVVGASTETDRQIISSSWDLYRKLGLNRIYFSAYQRGEAESDLPGEYTAFANKQLLTREHRLYQADWLMRKYGFTYSEIPVDPNGNLKLDTDPKTAWAAAHPEFFPVDINKDERRKLLRVPGLGPVTVERIYALRRQGAKIRSPRQLGRYNRILAAAENYLKF